jgi:hypothetical protein
MAAYFQIIENALFIGNIFDMLFEGWRSEERSVNYDYDTPTEKINNRKHHDLQTSYGGQKLFLAND